MFNKPTVMYAWCCSKDRICHFFFKIFASHQKNGTMESFKLLDIFISQLFKTADNSDNVLKHNIFFFKSLK